MQLSDFGIDSFDSLFRPYRVHQEGVKSSQVTGNEIVSVNTPHLVGKYTIAKFSLVLTNPHIFLVESNLPSTKNQCIRPPGEVFWGCAAGTLEPLAYTRASSAEFCYPILD